MLNFAASPKLFILLFMAANKFGRYIWLADLIRCHPYITFNEISERWETCGLGDGKPLPWKTFMNHKKAVQTIFDILISCDTSRGYGYYIEDADSLEGDSFRSWLIDSYATLNQLQADRQLEKRISFEKIPSGNKYLQTFLQAMRQNCVVEITHQGFGRSHASTFQVEPYHLKVYNRRWYLIGYSVYSEEIRTYALDRIQHVSLTDVKFQLPKDFSIEQYFEGCVGIISDPEYDIERVVIKAYGWARNYLSTLPLHESQREIASDDESITFEFSVRPNYEFFQLLLQQTDQIEILEPQWAKDAMCQMAENILSYYKKSENA